MRREKQFIIITVAICIMGCASILIYNVIDAYYSSTEIIPMREYNEGTVIASSDEKADSTTKEGTININTASAEQIAEFLPGIGEKKAAKIVEYREQSGGFASVDELVNVEGIGEKTLENIRPYCRLND